MKQDESPIGAVAVAALFTLGDLLLRHPWRYERGSLIAVGLLTAAGAVLAAGVLYPLLRWLWCLPFEETLAGRISAGLVALPVAGYAVVCLYRCCATYVDMAVELILPGGASLPPSLLLLLCALLLSCMPLARLEQFAWPAGCVVLLSVVIVLAFGFPHFQMEYLQDETVLPLETGHIWELCRELIPLGLMALLFATNRSGVGKQLAAGILTGGGLLLLCMLQVILTFGGRYAAELPYPYAYAVRILSVGPYFFRLEGLSYLPDLLSCLVRGAVCLSLVGRLAHRLIPRLARVLPPLCAIVVLLFFCLR